MSSFLRSTTILSSLLLGVAASACGGASDEANVPAPGSPSASSGGAAAEGAPPAGGDAGSSGGPAVVAPSSSSCDPSEPCIEADVDIDGTVFHFAERAVYGELGDRYRLSAVDGSVPFGVTLSWKHAEVVAGKSYPSTLSGEVLVSVVRKHPTGGKRRMSTAENGSVVFTETGANGKPAAGTFDGVEVVRTDPDDTIHIKLLAGRFRAAGL